MKSVGLTLSMAAACLVASCAEGPQDVVHTSSGAVRGTVRSTTAGPVRAFFGIPFAEPPLGERRFRKPMPKMPWRGILNATALPPLCPQNPMRMNSYFAVTETDPISEDCLFLNVFAPARNDSVLRPVVAYIHGGAFTFGGISLKIFDASELAVRGDLVVVTIAYRLGPLGFLYMDTEDAPGNMGLYDQQLALQWVRDNARSFGASPDAITVMGQSAGGISIGIHVLSPSSAGLFHRAFMQSGSPFIGAFVTTPEQAKSKAETLASYLDCKESDSHDLSRVEVLACMRSKSVGDVLSALENFDEAEFNGFFPFFGGDFVPKMLQREFTHAQLNARDFLVSVCEADGDFLIAYLLEKFNILENLDKVTERRMEAIMRLVLLRGLPGADIDAIIERYLSPASGKNAVELARAAGAIVGDWLFACPAASMVHALAAANVSVRALRYSEQLSFLDWPEWVRPTHGDDVVFSLGSSLGLGGSPSDADVRATEEMINVVSTFARTG
ncbi:hypothetical protein HPB50_021160 [Hyalomma asiaticum]|uniref:Uncharacterized protein n=1 Tax=Hyalomma asiaticum TaxID=266040 RepID=A0ACB7SBA2_HYAAI|nr:hypothetical protein HPB50_021160 [Hyalomma asiaticum]